MQPAVELLMKAAVTRLSGDSGDEWLEHERAELASLSLCN